MRLLAELVSSTEKVEQILKSTITRALSLRDAEGKSSKGEGLRSVRRMSEAGISTNRKKNQQNENNIDDRNDS